MAQRWPKMAQCCPKMAQDGPKKGEIILKTWNILTIQLSFTAREISIYLKNPVFELKKNYLAFRRDKTKNTSLFIPKIRGVYFQVHILKSR